MKQHVDMRDPEVAGLQRAQVLEHLQSGQTITAVEALDAYGIGRLAAVVFDLRKEGHPIVTAMIRVEKPAGVGFTTVARYRLAPIGPVPEELPRCPTCGHAIRGGDA